MNLPLTLDRCLQAFSGYDPLGGVGLPMDFMDSTGVLRPIEQVATFERQPHSAAMIGIAGNDHRVPVLKLREP